ncbi:MAG TPA: NAD(P)H-hydrate dehydratase [Pyrinomonadaceae bacterium]
MQRILSAAEMRDVDRLTTERYATPSLLLMEAAAGAAARSIAAQVPGGLAGKTARIICGRGNNGGDGAALARALWLGGVRTDVVLLGRVDATVGDARVNFEIVRRLASFEAGSRKSPPPLTFVECETVSDWEEVSRPRHTYDIIVDAMFGTGLSRPLAGIPLQVVEHLALMRQARERAHETDPLIVSLDIPSGLNADSAEVMGEAVRADLTVTFTAPKQANVLPPASAHNGRLHIAPIGSPPALLEAATSKLFLTEAEDARRWLVQTRYLPDSYKNRHGHALLVAGSRSLTGAAVLSANASMRAGAGLVTLAVPESVQASALSRLMPEVMTAALAETTEGAVSLEAVERVMQLQERASVIALGPGLTSAEEATRRFVREVVERRARPLIIDADGLNALAPWPAELRGSPERPLILTPHAGEMLRLLGTTDSAALADRVAAARDFAASHSLILVLKGTRTLIAAPDGSVYVNPTGNAGLGTAGSGDTLTGVITSFVAQAFATLLDEADALPATINATIAALYVSGLAGDLAARDMGMRTMTASDIREHLSEAVRTLDAEGERP